MSFSADLARQLRDTLNQERVLTFGADATLTFYAMTPGGETQLGVIAEGWGGHRLTGTAAGTATAGDWTFRICAADALPTGDMKKAATLAVNGVRWKIRKSEKPIGPTGTWALRAEMI